VKDETVWMAGGRLFHARDAATGKARSPRVNRCTDGTASVMVVDERIAKHLISPLTPVLLTTSQY